MSEDLRYYFFDHEADDQPSISAEEGWKNMQQLLDKEMPMASKRNPRRYFFVAVALLTGIVLLTTSLPLKNYFEQPEITALAKHKVTNANDASNNTKELNKDVNAKKESNTIEKLNEEVNADANSIATAQQNSVEKKPDNNFFVQQYNSDKSAIKVEQNAAKEIEDKAALSKKTDKTNTAIVNNTKNGIANSANENISSKSSETITPSLDNTTQTSSATSAGKKEEAKKITSSKKDKKTANDNFHPYWNLNAGLGINFSLSNTFNSFHPYPFAELKYNFSPRFYAGASLALFSPVGSKANGVTKTVYVNDIASNVSKYDETLNYTSLTYANAALAAGFKINKKLSIQTGIQFSRLLNTTTKTTLEPYDFNSNALTVQDTDLTRLPPTPSAAPVYNNRIDVQKFDIRYIAGINYDLKKISLGLQYQAGFNPVLKGDIVSDNKNKLIMLKVAYRFK